LLNLKANCLLNQHSLAVVSASSQCGNHLPVARMSHLKSWPSAISTHYMLWHSGEE